MPGNSPIYGLPYLVGSDGGKRIKEVSEALALKLEAVLAQNGNPPLDSDLVSLLQRLGAVEDKVDAPPVIRNAIYAASKTNIADAIVPPVLIGTPARQPGSQNDSFVKSGGDGKLIITGRGVYAVTWKAELKHTQSGGGAGVTGRSFIELSPSIGAGARNGITISEDVATISVANIVVGETPLTLEMRLFKTTGSPSNVVSTINVTKVI